MIQHLLLPLLLLPSWLLANTIVVKNIDELNNANQKAKPGDVIVLQNGEWKNVTILLNCRGTKELPITIRAETAGKVLITGLSKLMIGGAYIVVDGLYFTNGYAGSDAVITFRMNKEQLATHCRVTNTVINDFNNPKRMDENYWVAFYGTYNRLDYCSFKNKKNLGVLLAVILDDERSRENFHEIANNYFGKRPSLGSDGGEIIRVGVAQHSLYNSRTQIMNNFFEYCDGETEIISIKSGGNIIQDNIFKESQGSLVLRHGDNNVVSGNLFMGNDKPATGGVCVINKGQVVRNNVFYKCRGTAFTAPLAIMNGIPDSPPLGYVQVTDATISNNIFYQSSPMSFGEGSDAERMLPPDRVSFTDNIFYNTRDAAIYTTSDAITGFHFQGNKVNTAMKQVLADGFDKIKLPVSKFSTGSVADPLFADISMIPLVLRDMGLSTGASWFPKHEPIVTAKPVVVNCVTAEEVYQQLEGKDPVIIRLSGKEYTAYKPFVIRKKVQFTGNKSTTIRLSTGNLPALFVVSSDGHLELNNLSLDGTKTKTLHLIASDSSGLSNHYNLAIRNSRLQNFSRENGCENLFYAFRYTIADSIVIRNTSFVNNNNNILTMAEEKDDKGYYNAEKIVIISNSFSAQKGSLLTIYRGGNDESTRGPALTFSNNKLNDCQSGDALIKLTGVQVTRFSSNMFSHCNPSGSLIAYRDRIRARHLLERNTFRASGIIEKNQFVIEK